MKIAPLTRYLGSVGSSIVSEVEVSTGVSDEAWATRGPSIGRAARIRAGVQKRRAAPACSRKEIDGAPVAVPPPPPPAAAPAAPAAGAASAPISSAAARTTWIWERDGLIREGDSSRPGGAGGAISA